MKQELKQKLEEAKNSLETIRSEEWYVTLTKEEIDYLLKLKELKPMDIVDAYVQGSIRENPCVDEQEVNRMIANGNIYWNINFSGLTNKEK